MIRWIRFAVPCFVLALLAGCTIGSPTLRSTEPPPTLASQSATPGGAGTPLSPSPADRGADAAGIDSANPPKPVGTVRVSCAPGYLEWAEVSVLGVRRHGEVVIATFSVVGQRRPGQPATPPAAGERPSLGNCSQAAFDPRLIDAQNLVAYLPLKLGPGDSLATNPYEIFPDAEPTYLSAVFPAPKAGVTSVDVFVGSGTVAQVPLS